MKVIVCCNEKRGLDAGGFINGESDLKMKKVNVSDLSFLMKSKGKSSIN